MNLRKLASGLLVVVLLFSVTACTHSKKESTAQKEKITILYPNWAEGIAFTDLAKVALDNHGYNVDLISLEPGLIYGELSKKHSKGDIFMDAWLPNTHKAYWKAYGSKLVKLGEAFSDGTTGLVVPSYVTINSIDQLNKYKAKFGGRIIGIGSGAGIYANTNKAITAYGLHYEQIASSGPAMVASLQKAIKDKKWIVITGWKPHYMWARFDIKYLKDPKGIFPKDECTIISRRGFEKDHPKAAVFFKNFNLNETELYSLMDSINVNGDEVGAEKWYKSNKALVDGWLK